MAKQQTVWTLLVLLIIALTATTQPRPSIKKNLRININPCLSSYIITNKELLTELSKSFKYIGDYELPIIALVRKEDSLLCYISAIISTYSIRKNPPTAFIKVLDREALLYTGTESVGQLTSDCQQQLINRYSSILHIDKINKKEGRPTGSDIGGSYDPILVKISLVNGHIVPTTHRESFPFFDHGPQ